MSQLKQTEQGNVSAGVPTHFESTSLGTSVGLQATHRCAISVESFEEVLNRCHDDSDAHVLWKRMQVWCRNPMHAAVQSHAHILATLPCPSPRVGPSGWCRSDWTERRPRRNRWGRMHLCRSFVGCCRLLTGSRRFGRHLSLVSGDSSYLVELEHWLQVL